MTEFDDHRRVFSPDPDVEALLAMMSGAPPISSMAPDAARAAMLAAGPIFYPEMPPVQEQRTTIAGVPVRIYRPLDSDPATPLAALLYFHGGGWVMGDMDGFAPSCATIAQEAGIAVISVDYNLAPEYRFPEGLEQGVAVADMLFTEGAKYGADSSKLAIGGDSAGGNLATVITLDRRNRGLANFRHQLLIYPVTDCRFLSESYRDCGDAFFMSLADLEWFRSHYLPGDADVSDWRISPLLAESHESLPPAHILTCGLDPLQDDGNAYADALQRAGIDVTRHHYAGMIHGFLFMGAAIKAVKPALSELAEIVSRALGTEPAARS